MKRLQIIFILLLGITAYSQTITEKYNSIMNRYEYFDTQGQMIGYKSYDSLMAEWKYYDLSKTQSKQTSQYVKPINLNLLKEALSSKQQRYDNNVNKIQEAINDIAAKIVALKLDSDVFEAVNLSFDNALKFITIQKYDYSNNTITQNTINYLYQQVNNELAFQSKLKEDLKNKPSYQSGYQQKQTNTATTGSTSATSSERKEALDKLTLFGGGYTTQLVTEEVYNPDNPTKYNILNKDTSTTKFFFQNNYLSFLRSNNKEWLGSEWKLFSTDENYYILTDNYNQVITISKDFKTVTFYANKVGDHYNQRFVYHNLKRDVTVSPF